VGNLVAFDIKYGNCTWLYKKVGLFDLLSSMQSECSELIDSLVAEHHRLYKILFKDPLKPKHHNMVHFGYARKMSGPLVNLSTVRYEAKHRPQTKRAAATSSRKNITYTIAMKEQLT